MGFTAIRIAISVILLAICLLFVFALNRFTKGKWFSKTISWLKKAPIFYKVALSLVSIWLIAQAFAPQLIENQLSFNTPEEAFSYFNFNGNVVQIIDSENCAFIVSQKWYDQSEQTFTSAVKYDGKWFYQTNGISFADNQFMENTVAFQVIHKETGKKMIVVQPAPYDPSISYTVTDNYGSTFLPLMESNNAAIIPRQFYTILDASQMIGKDYIIYVNSVSNKFYQEKEMAGIPT